MIAVLGAMDAEVADVIAHMSDVVRSPTGSVTLHTGSYRGRRVVCARTGVGKVMSAVTTTRVVERYRPEAILYVGIAGALDRDFAIGDLVVAKECVQHDLDARMFGFARGEVPYEGIRWLPADPVLLARASSYTPPAGRLHRGRIATGDQFCDAETRKARPYLVDELGASAVEMEGAAAALAARSGGVPFLHARIISDRADGTAPDDFNRFLPAAASKIEDFVAWMVDGLDPT